MRQNPVLTSNVLTAYSEFCEGLLPQEALEDIEDLSADAMGIPRDYHGPLVKGIEAMLDKDYVSAYRLFKGVMDKYPNEGEPSIRLCEAISGGGLDVDLDQEEILNKAEQLIKSGISKYPMDKFNGLSNLYFQRGVYYYGKTIRNKSYYDKATEDFNKALDMDPTFEKAKKALEKVYEKKGSSSGCFIATAAYGTEFAPDVMILKSFRDGILLKSRFGKAIVQVYYSISPPIARVIEISKILRKATRTILVSPIAKLCRTKLSKNRSSNVL